MDKLTQDAIKLHENVPPDWYYRSLKENIFQRFWHRSRFREVSKLIEPVEGKVLDIGSADGVFSKVVLEKTGAKKVIGIDVLESSVNWANKHWRRNKKLEFKVGDAHDLAKFKSQDYDAVFALEVLEHVFKPEKVLKEIKRVLKRGGYAVYLVPSESNLFKVVWFLWHFAGRMVWEDAHVQHFRKDSLVEIARNAGFEIEENHKFLFGMLQAIKVRKK